MENFLFLLTNMERIDIIAEMEVCFMSDICNFLPPATGQKDIVYHLFVYEAELYNLAQPFLKKHYCMHLAFRGNAVLQTAGKQYTLTPGTLFFTSPYQPYELIDDEKFTYLYITFDGPGVPKLMEQFGISKDRSVFPNFGHLTDFWMTSIRRVNPTNIHVLTESVLLHTLSYVEQFQKAPTITSSPQFDAVLQYINNNFRDPELSISKVAGIFCFSNKYFSALFSKNMQMKFTDYLSQIRINHAVTLMKEKPLPVNVLAVKCGYSDPFYFSKVFKRVTGLSPSQFTATMRK